MQGKEYTKVFSGRPLFLEIPANLVFLNNALPFRKAQEALIKLSELPFFRGKEVKVDGNEKLLSGKIIDLTEEKDIARRAKLAIVKSPNPDGLTDVNVFEVHPDGSRRRIDFDDEYVVTRRSPFGPKRELRAVLLNTLDLPYSE